MTIGKKHHPQNQTGRKPMPSHKCIVMKFIDFCSNWVNLRRLATILYPPKQLQPLGAEDKTSAAFLSPASCGVDSKPKKASSGRVIAQIPTSQTQRVYPKRSKNGIDKFDKQLDFGANLGNSQCVCSVLDTLGFTLFQCPRRTQRWRLCWRGRRDWPWKKGRPRWFVWHSSRCRVTGDPNWLRGVSHRNKQKVSKSYLRWPVWRN